MKIAILNKYQDKVLRGAETYVLELSKRLSKNHSVDVVSKINYLDLLKNKYDIVIPTNGRWQVLIVRLITWLTNSKMVVSGQSGIGLDDRINLYCFPNVFITLTDYQKNWARKINPFVKVAKIPNGVDLSEFNSQLTAHGSLFTVLSVGAFTKEKRHNLTIDAVAKMKNAKLTILGGGGELKEEIKKYGKEKLGDKFEIKTVDYKDRYKEFEKASVFAFPTVSWESFGIVLVEAMASGLPVVATDDPIRREIVGDVGIFVDPTNTDEYALSLEKALNTDWGDKPRKQAEKFSWDKIAEEYEKLFNTL
jgi:glycosyltransferase involved in cell wall biosynthesis